MPKPAPRRNQAAAAKRLRAAVKILEAERNSAVKSRRAKAAEAALGARLLELKKVRLTLKKSLPKHVEGAGEY